ncbi:hypothetical protein ABIA25_003973 [Sinorhizobium fredii]
MKIFESSIGGRSHGRPNPRIIDEHFNPRESFFQKGTQCDDIVLSRHVNLEAKMGLSEILAKFDYAAVREVHRDNDISIRGKNIDERAADTPCGTCDDDDPPWLNLAIVHASLCSTGSASRNRRVAQSYHGYSSPLPIRSFG